MSDTTTDTIEPVRRALELARADLDDALQALDAVQHVPLGVAHEVISAVSGLVEALERLANATAPLGPDVVASPPDRG